MQHLYSIVIFIVTFTAEYNCQSPCYTPEYTQGVCVSVYECPNVLDALQPPLSPQMTEYLRALQCVSGNGGGRPPFVCCVSAAPSRAQRPERPTWLSPVGSGNGHVLPTEGYCGHTALADRIYGGEESGLDDFPWMALLEYEKPGNFRSGRRKLSCGGALINQRYVLTAAHCLTGEIEVKVGKLIGVRLGEYDITKDVDCIGLLCADPVINMGVEAVIPHEGYDEKSRNRVNDIGLIRMNGNVIYSDFIKPICLPSSVTYTRSAPSTKWVSVGWGRTLKERMSPTKQKIDLPVVDRAACVAKYNTLGIDVEDTQICAGGVYGQDTCDGDSGNPLMRTSNNYWIVEGIVSFGRACGLEEWPAVYTRVKSYENWIRYNMRP